ncbi:DUF2157 domain-containing protein [Halioxenophilus sp. WMMB6]|uniref:DUF2157 domain-containing protein n=1 Tax=Halioxenophilus sp. WMMB6 TaxID=3073815 RepID=UPI00295E73AE|nr:DUF2157 domain-containing protein [Halioxenophilus sp. WMMB6]
MDNRQRAQQRADQIRQFQCELAELQQVGVLALGEAQQQAIANYHQQLLAELTRDYDVDVNQRQKQFSLGMKVASFIGALALAASIFFLFYQFWGYLVTPVQVLVLIASPLLTLLLSSWFARREATGYYAKLASMVSFACFVLNLMMLGSIYNFAPSENAFLLWAIYGLLLAYAFDVRLLLGAAILSFAGFLAARTCTYAGGYWIYMGERPEVFLLPAVAIFTLPLWLKSNRYSGFAPIYRVLACLLCMIPVLILANYGRASYLPWDRSFIEGFYQLLGFTLSALLITLGVRQQWNDCVNTGNSFFVLFLYTKFFDWWWQSLPKYLFFLLIALVSIALLVFYKRYRSLALGEGQRP